MAGPSGNETNHIFNGATIQGGLALEGTGGVTTYLNRDVAAMNARQAALLRGTGYYAETFPYAAANTSLAGTSQTVYAMAIGLVAGDVVSNILCGCQTAVSVPTLVKFGLYSKTGTLLASSADVSANYASTGAKSNAMSTPYTVLTDDVYYVAHLSVATTAPALFRGLGSSNGFQAFGSGVARYTLQASQSDLPASATFTAGANGVGYWLGVS